MLRSTAIAAGVAVVLLVTTILPGEYGIDPTGAARVLGLTSMGEIKVQLAQEAEAGAQAGVAPTSTPGMQAAVVAPAPDSDAGCYTRAGADAGTGAACCLCFTDANGCR
ncbi:hypothetical protein [Bordetella ansorpii]|uniref:hypothetical protein n=1 Tax=Bordetella ansorpii TaxID=288768 RepID=UPI001F31356C|nr:hypothetical protein [Bordetella ansorpii]